MSANFIKVVVMTVAIMLFPGCASTSDVKLTGEQAAAAQKTANEAKMSADAALLAAEAAKAAAEEAKQAADQAKQSSSETDTKINQVFRKSMHK